MDKLDFKAKLGAFPVWVWGAIAAVVALVGYFLYARVSGGGSATPAASSIDAMGYQTSGIKMSNSATTETTVPENNTQWLARVSRSVADSLSASPSEVYGALYKYITGQAITAKEQGYVDTAIRVGMSPPDGTQGVSEVIPNTVPKPADPATLREYVKNSSGTVAAFYRADNVGTNDYFKVLAPSELAGVSARTISDSDWNIYKKV